MKNEQRKVMILLLAAAATVVVTAPVFGAAAKSVIVQGAGVAEVAELVKSVGGEVTHELGIIRAVSAELTPSGLQALRGQTGVRRIYDNHRVTSARKPWSGGGGGSLVDGDGAYTHYPALVGADRLHAEGITGRRSTIAMLDTGVWEYYRLSVNTRNRSRLLARYNAILDVTRWTDDDSGHGTHVASIALSSDSSAHGHHGIAPDADLVAVKAFDENGVGTYADVIRGLDWVVAHKSRYGIGVLNLSFSGPPQSHYWDDPLNQAVMRAWQAGIVVVVSAGNGGPSAMSVGVPGNVPYVVTVGAMSDNYTPGDGSDDVLASFSAAGPTYEAFVKPEVVAPGGHMRGIMSLYSQIAQEHPEFHDGGFYFTMSGTSQAAGVVSGIVALMLDAAPGLTPDEVKCRLMDAARPAVDDAGALAYSIFQQGAGLVNAYDAVYSAASGCANQGLDVDLDLAGVRHYAGRARQAEDGFFYVLDQDGFIWSEDFISFGGFIWSEDYLWQDGFIWSESEPFVSGFIWSESFFEVSGFIWSENLTEPMSINTWVLQE